MASHKYYDLSSDNDDSYGDDNGYSSCSSDDDDGFPTSPSNANSNTPSGQDPLWGRPILHLDIDCFYVQAEEIQRELRTSGKPIPPMAVGQKRIIVTANYLGRSMGVKKLQSKREALETCPTLWIVDGSDLRHYRKHSRVVYEAFRRTMYDLYRRVFRDSSSSSSSSLSMETIMKRVACVRGSMDEMMTDLSTVVNKIANEPDGGEVILNKLMATQQDDDETPHKLHIFGEDSQTSVELVEDQTGASTTVSFRSSNSSHGTYNLSQSRRNIHETHQGNKTECRKRLEIASRLGRYICFQIQQQTQFHTTVGISVSPLLAKLASGLTKPKAINVLLPWRTSELLYGMPLRKMPNIGHRTMKALEGALREGMLNGSGDDDKSTIPCTVIDLLRLPRERILECLSGLQTGSSSENSCDLLLDRCRGVDASLVVDDEGGTTKTVSVEDSFRRGTVKSMDKVWDSLNSLFIRLPQLLQDRATWSSNPKYAYPSTLRLTVRLVDQSLKVRKRRPFVTRSKQISVNGKALMEATDATKRASLLAEWVTPLVKSLLVNQRNTLELDLTRMNLAVTNFADIARKSAALSLAASTSMEAFTKKRPSQTQSQTQHTISKRPKTKALTTTRIDHFFFKKK